MDIKPLCEILSYCLMPNHYHFLIMTKDVPYDKHSLARKIGTVQSSYAQAINKKMIRVGSLFQQKAKAKLIENNAEYLFACFNYIHQNPFVGGLVEKLEDWEFSSYRDFAGFREGTLINKKLASIYLDLPEDLNEFRELSYRVINNVRVNYILY